MEDRDPSNPVITHPGELTPEECLAAEAQKAGGQVLCPAYRYIEPETESLLRYLEMRGIAVMRGVGASDIVRVRSRLATAALHAKKTRILWVDADQYVAPADAVRLLLSEEPFVTAAAPSRIPPYRLLIDLLDPEGSFSLGEKGGLVRIRHSGMGMVAHDVDLLARLASSLDLTTEGWYPFFLPVLVRQNTAPETYQYLSEDYAFCERLHLEGFPLYADTRIRCWHVGSHAYRWEDVYFTPPPDQNMDIAFRRTEPLEDEPLSVSDPYYNEGGAPEDGPVAATPEEPVAPPPPPAPSEEPHEPASAPEPSAIPRQAVLDIAKAALVYALRSSPDLTAALSKILENYAPEDEPVYPPPAPQPPADYVPGEPYPRPKA